MIDAIGRFGGGGKSVVVDPAMADDGKLYPVFDETMAASMKKLVSHATLITPNYTEACLLTDTPYQAKPPTDKELETLCDKLLSLGPKAIVITSVPTDSCHIAIASQTDSQLFPEKYEVPKLPFGTCGTGDIFTSTLLAYILRGKDLNLAVQHAADFLRFVIETTLNEGTDPHEGVLLEGCLWKLLVPQTKDCTSCKG